MKTIKAMLVFIIGLILTLALCFATFSDKILDGQESILVSAEKACVTLQGHINKIPDKHVDITSLLDQIDALTRENVVLRQEVASQASQLNLYEEGE